MIPGSIEGGNGESGKSMLGEGDCMLTNSAVWSVKMRASSVFISGPAGYQKLPEQDPEEPWVTHGSGIARASCTVGKWKLPEDGPTRITRENVTEKTIISLRSFFLVKNYPKWRPRIIDC
jgi:hypothetical protein